jgi:hypothetical protein
MVNQFMVNDNPTARGQSGAQVAVKNFNRSYTTKAGHTRALRIPTITDQNPFACWM